MGKLFGTDGIRGIVGDTLDASLAYRVGQAVVAVLEEKNGRRPVITIGKDTRISSDMLECALIAGICSMGGDVMPLGTVPTPAVAYLTVKEKADAGIVISASHNPFDNNGIKIFNECGYKLPDEVELAVEEKILSGEKLVEKTGEAIGRRLRGAHKLKAEYVDYVAATVESDFAGLRVAVDCANGAASATAPDLFAKFKIEADIIHAEPDGININNGCGSTHMDKLREKVLSGGYDLGIAFDGDADRCLFLDEKGELIDGDQVLSVCATEMKAKGKLNGNTVVATVMSNLGLHEFCRNNDIGLICTSVGDRNVLEEMLSGGYRIGGEQSGHTIFSEFATTGDGEVTAMQFLQVLKNSGKKASELASCCARYPQVLVNVKVSPYNNTKERVMESPELLAAVKEEEAKLAGSGRVLVRASGTEALIRVMVEAKTEEIASEVAERLAEMVKNI
ncbi:MAG: phosphoglucosamine mutase [Oscillospiraceae bacterium]|nr:phosphoglucosamine mutase [Oscillospiraceae bacterium]